MHPSSLPSIPDWDPDAPGHQKPWQHSRTAPSGCDNKLPIIMQCTTTVVPLLVATLKILWQR